MRILDTMFTMAIVLSFYACQQNRNHHEGEVSGRLELNVVEVKNDPYYHTGLAVAVHLRNNTDRKIFVDFARPVIGMMCIQKKHNGGFVDVSNSLVKDELIIPPAVRKQVIEEKEEVDSFTQALADTIRNRYLQSDKAKQHASLKKLVFDMRANSMLYLDAGQQAVLSLSCTSLLGNKGSYRVFLQYTGSVPELYKDIDPIPVNLKGYRRWEGKISSDTLYLNIN